MLKMTVGDFKHWIGWALTTGAVISFIKFMPYAFTESIWYWGAGIFGVVVLVDVIKHFLKLQ